MTLVHFQVNTASFLPNILNHLLSLISLYCHNFLSHYMFSKFSLHPSFCPLKTTVLVVESLQFTIFLAREHSSFIMTHPGCVPSIVLWLSFEHLYCIFFQTRKARKAGAAIYVIGIVAYVRKDVCSILCNKNFK